jgi:deoxycytidine triphosphate deaminase
MILCDREIQALIEADAIRIEPLPKKELWTSTAIDLTLSKVLLKWVPKEPPPGQPAAIRPKSPNFNVQAMMEDPHFAEKVEIGPQGFELRPNDFVLGFTHQIVRFPNRARIAHELRARAVSPVWESVFM